MLFKDVNESEMSCGRGRRAGRPAAAAAPPPRQAEAAAAARGEGAERGCSSPPPGARGPYLGPPRLGPWAARRWGMAGSAAAAGRAAPAPGGARGEARGGAGSRAAAVGGRWPRAGGRRLGSAATARVFPAGRDRGGEGG